MKKNPNKKVFVSSKSDRGILVKILDQKVSLSFWGSDNPKNVSFSKEEAMDMCVYIIENIDESSLNESRDVFGEAYVDLRTILPDRHFEK